MGAQKVFENKIKYPTNYNYHKMKITNDEIFESVDIWDKYFEIKFINKNSNGTECWMCINSKIPKLCTSCSSELQAHKICMVAMYKIWWRSNKFIKIPNISSTVNRKSNELIGDFN